jgi:hypothetical protein
MSQLGLDGHETTHPVRAPRPLTARQRELVAYMRGHVYVRPIDVGRLMRGGRVSPTRDNNRHVSSDGVDALRRLQRRGLVERVERGRWMLVEHDEAWA